MRKLTMEILIDLAGAAVLVLIPYITGAIKEKPQPDGRRIRRCGNCRTGILIN